jgi:hypothetical protein
MSKYTAKDGHVVYLDADLFFFDSPNQIFSDLGTGSIGIIEHKYNSSLEKKLQKYGQFNVGLVIFKHDQHGISLLTWYLDSCIDWCGDTPSKGRYADQGYLDQFPDWEGCVILKSPGFNLAPWNDSNYKLAKMPDGKIYVDQKPLIFFHFHGLRKFKNRYITSEPLYKSRLTKVIRNDIYLPYVAEIENMERYVNLNLVNPSVTLKRGIGYKKYLFRTYKYFLSLFMVISGNSINTENLNHQKT